MCHKPIILNSIAVTFPQKVCFRDFSTQIHPGARLAIIGQNGSGKSTLLKILQGMREPDEGNIVLPKEIFFGYVPQIIEEFETLSGGQRLNESLTQALSLNPDVLLLDEPTNHLDVRNRQSLMRMLRSFPGTLIIVSHDVELLRTCIDTLWHIENEKVTVFSGNYNDYWRERDNRRASLSQEISCLDRQKKRLHKNLMHEQERAKKSKLQAQKHMRERRWPTVSPNAMARGVSDASCHKRSSLSHKKQDLFNRLEDLHVPEIIVPKFSLSPQDVGFKTIVSIQDGSVGYDYPIVRDITLSLNSQDHLAITGDNGSGKSTLVRGILSDPNVIKDGEWIIPKCEDIGYLDQHYGTLESAKTVLEVIHELVPTWPHADIRRHLNDFLFRKNEEVNALVSTLSGGEKVRLSLAQIAAKTPKLLILDEVTNNLDLETLDHVVQILKNYPGSMIVISHDQDFLERIGVRNVYSVGNNSASTLRTS